MSATLDRYRLTGKDTQAPEIPSEGRARKSSRVHAQAEIRHGAVEDPNPAFKGARQRVAINIKHDVLESEFQRKRISIAAYLTMLEYQGMLERLAGKPTGGGQWEQGSRVSPELAAELRMIRLIDSAREALDLQNRVAPALGLVGGQIVRMALLERVGFETIGARFYKTKPNKAQVFYIAETFRNSCEAMAEHLAAHGPNRKKVATAC